MTDLRFCCLDAVLKSLCSCSVDAKPAILQVVPCQKNNENIRKRFNNHFILLTEHAKMLKKLVASYHFANSLNLNSFPEMMRYAISSCFDAHLQLFRFANAMLMQKNAIIQGFPQWPVCCVLMSPCTPFVYCTLMPIDIVTKDGLTKDCVL